MNKRINPNPCPPPLDEIASLFHPYLRRSPLRSPSLSPSVRRRSPPPFSVAFPFRSPSISRSLHSVELAVPSFYRARGPFIPLSSRSLHSVELAVPSFRRAHGPFIPISLPLSLSKNLSRKMFYADFLAGSFPSSSSAGLGSPATQGTSVPQPQPASIIEDRLLNELLVAPGRELLPKLSPNGEPNTSWFRRSNRNAICKSILKCFHSLLQLPYPTYAHQDWNWDPRFTNDVRTAFNLQARKQYTSNVTEWKKKWRLKKDKPICLNQDVWDGFKAYWQLDAIAHIAATNSVNRRSKRGGKGEAVHNGGAKTREEREIEMTAEKGGVPPDWLELMRDMHTNKQTGEVQDPVARELLATLSKLKEDKEAQLQQSQLSANDGSTASNMLSHEEINQLVLENVPIKKGRRYGIGRTSEAISTSSSQHLVSSSSILQYIDRMKTELDEERTKRRAIEEELRRVTVFISNLCPEQFSATQTQPDSAIQSPDDRCF
ncbi:hypothetical protein HID58_089264 [Brassica napus]|uniref:Uncharacterized protein n=1 Tax=Brassica napus TaxID=3708 RepID=A0ABQ7XYH8_BRANA|nr:hypothetical protein HID58_089264 [Brassica napus]